MSALPLTKGYEALVDDEDYERLRVHKWTASEHPGGRVYAVRRERLDVNRWRTILLHREVLGLPPGRVPEVDHINRNGLDNRRENLRAASRSQNNANQAPQTRVTSSRFKGVSWVPRLNRWRASIKENRRSYHLGYFATEEHAAAAYDRAAQEMFGAFARPNGAFR